MRRFRPGRAGRLLLWLIPALPGVLVTHRASLHQPSATAERSPQSLPDRAELPDQAVLPNQTLPNQTTVRTGLKVQKIREPPPSPWGGTASDGGGPGTRIVTHALRVSVPALRARFRICVIRAIPDRGEGSRINWQ